eukprot:7008624-Heterocapsa_arctica.AAC.1
MHSLKLCGNGGTTLRKLINRALVLGAPLSKSPLNRPSPINTIKVEIPATVIDRAYGFIDMQNDASVQDNGMIEMDINKAKRLFDLVRSETTAK